jgi:hypothetical protein
MAAMVRVSIAVLAACLCGCVERELTITSEPQGAVVRLSHVEIGRTPVTQSFTHYGDYDIIVSMDGYETVKTSADIRAPWYEWVGIDFVSEILPWTFYDRRYVHIKLPQARMPSDQEIVDRALEMQRKNEERVDR